MTCSAVSSSRRCRNSLKARLAHLPADTGLLGALFTLDDVDEHSTAIDGEVPAHLEQQATDAIRYCPEQAISVIG